MMAMACTLHPAMMAMAWDSAAPPNACSCVCSFANKREALTHASYLLPPHPPTPPHTHPHPHHRYSEQRRGESLFKDIHYVDPYPEQGTDFMFSSANMYILSHLQVCWTSANCAPC
jgi:hypothetical protein